MKILGIDYGEKRIGLAVSDESQTLARELSILSPKEFWQSLNHLILNHSITKIVLGWPTNLSGQETKKTQEINNFKLRLEAATGLKVNLMDERFSSQMAIHLRQGFGGLASTKRKRVAKNLPGGKQNVDSLAAQIILQNFLDKQKSV